MPRQSAESLPLPPTEEIIKSALEQAREMLSGFMERIGAENDKVGPAIQAVRQAIQTVLEIIDPKTDFSELSYPNFFAELAGSRHARELFPPAVRRLAEYSSEIQTRVEKLQEAFDALLKVEPPAEKKPKVVRAPHEGPRTGEIKCKIIAAVKAWFLEHPDEEFASGQAFAGEMGCTPEYPRMVLREFIDAGYIGTRGERQSKRYFLTDKGKAEFLQSANDGVPAAAA